jgi:DMSO/TMAO reductase YedYZ molybdopterin-dependent catalytic subunit
MTDPTKLTLTKQRWAQEGRFLTGRSARAGTDRLPPGQHLVRDWPVLDLGTQPAVPPDRWELRVFGAVGESITWDWAGFQALPQRREVTDIHCVTTWSRYDNQWDGVATRDLMALAQPKPEARFVMLHSFDGYTTNLPLDDFLAEDAILAHAWQGAPLTRLHGGPVRLVVPHLYLWKSAKWLHRIEVTAEDRPGYWEQNGYHMRGDPWAEQRYSE